MQKKDLWLVVVNVFAASKKAGSVWKRAAVMLDNAGVRYKAVFTGGKYNAVELTENACRNGFRKFIAVGGDGTIHDVLNGIALHIESAASADVLMSDFVLGVIPVGSGNDWVKSAGVPKDIASAVKVIAEGRTTMQDVVKVSILNPCDITSEPLHVSYMVNVGGVGLDARVCEIVNRKKEQGLRGKHLYVSALLYCIAHRVPVKASIICDGKELFRGKYLSVAFGVGKYSGGGMRQTPLAELGDGLLDVTVIPDIPLMKIAKEVPKLFTGKFHTVEVLSLAQCRDVLVMPEGEGDAEPVEVDGEVVGRAPVRMEVLSGRINVVIGDRH